MLCVPVAEKLQPSVMRAATGNKVRWSVIAVTVLIQALNSCMFRAALTVSTHILGVYGSYTLVHDAADYTSLSASFPDMN